MIVLDGTSREIPGRERNWDRHLERAFRAGAEIAGAEETPERGGL
jgi:hypothetical protein